MEVSQKAVTIEKGIQRGTKMRVRDTTEKPLLRNFCRFKKSKVSRAHAENTLD